jgi:hypothetical protein
MANSPGTGAVANINDAPVINSNGGGATASLSVLEGSLAVTTVAATDVDGPSLVYSIAGGADAARFSINPGTGVLNFVTAPNYEIPADADGNNQYLVTVQASDGSLGDTQAVTVSIIDKTAALLVYDWKAHTLLDGVSVTVGATTHSTDTGGSTSFTSFTDPSISLTASRAIPSAEATLTSQAVNLQDAIAILKMIVGLDVNGAGKPLSPYQSLAADYNGDGTVGLTDAIGVLKHVVGLPAPDPVWKFVNEIDAGIPGKVGLNPGILPGTISADVSGAVTQVHVGLVGILIGDVDGSFAGMQGSLDLDLLQLTYFVDLTYAHGLQLSQFGVYP